MELSPTPGRVPAVPYPTFVRRLVVNGPLPCRLGGRSFRDDHNEDYLEWTPDGAHLIFNHAIDPTLWMVDSEGIDLRTVVHVNPVVRDSYTGFPEAMKYGHYASVSPDGLRIAYSTCEFRTDSLEDRYEYHEGDHNLYHYEIAIVGIDGESPVRLTENDHYDHYPEWSPDGTRITFIANSRERESQTDRWRLFTMSPDGSNVFQVSDKRAALYPPVWSLDGRRIAFAVEEPSAPYERVVYTVQPDGSELTRVNRVLRVEGKPAFLPSWSPDSAELAFAGVDGSNADGWTVTIYVVNPYGGGLRDVWRRDYVGGYHPRPEVSQVSWSPDGAELLVIVNGGIWLGHPDGSAWRRLAPRPLDVMSVGAAAWSSDGSKIAFHGTYGARDEFKVIAMARDLTDLRVLVGEEVVPNPDTESPYPRIARLYAWNEQVREADVDLTACSAGVVVPEPEQNPGLVEDCRTLLSFRDALAGRAQLGWDAVTPIAEWEGIALGGAPLRVHAIVLSDVTGRVTPALGDLTELRVLDLSGNPLTGEIPRELGRLAQLESLGLGATYLSGHIPPELGRLANLQQLYLNYSNLSGPIPPELGGLGNLQWLYLNSTNLSGPIPPELGGLGSLERLDLSSTSLSGPIPPELGALGSLFELNLSSTNLSGPIPPELGALGSLFELNLSSTNLSGPIPPEFGGLGSLETLNLEETGLIGCIPPGVPESTSVKSELERCAPAGVTSQ